MNKFMKRLMSKKDGFTLVELIVVIAILAILAGIAVPAYTGYIKKANDAAALSELSAIVTAAQAVASLNGDAVSKITVTYTAASGNTAASATISVDTNGTDLNADSLGEFYDDANLATLLGKSNSYNGTTYWTSATGWTTTNPST